MTHLRKVKGRDSAPAKNFLKAALFACGIGGLIGSACADGGTVSEGTASVGSGTGGRGEATSSSSRASSGAGGEGGKGTNVGGAGGVGGVGGAGGEGGEGGAGGAGGACEPVQEACDGLDNDCDGVVDDGNPDGGGECMAQATGECAKGTLTCVNAALECLAGMPKAETCDNLDNNCDGVVDDGDPGGGSQCVTQHPGACALGKTKCDGANGVVCEPNVQPGQQPETCNALDDDCNGMADEGNPGGGVSCVANGFGVCKNGTLNCQNGQLKCTPGMAAPEVCDGLDNNCDGNTDEGNPGGGIQCTTAFMGLCASGVTQCDGVNGVTCKPNVVPGMIPESCNGIDDDCDGSVDEEIAAVGQPCTAAGFVGICQFGTYSCPSMAPFQLQCDHPNPGTVQETCNGKDDDCNGTIDDPALVNNVPCATGFPGACATGKSLCSGGSLSCTPNVAPNSQTEICNSVDDNCNGMTDEMNPTPACTSQNPNAQFVQAWACNMGTCQIMACQSGHTDINVAPGDGCECTTDSWQNNCPVASTLSVPIGGTTTMVGKIETANGSDWVTFNFTPTAVGQLYRPKIQLTDSAGGQYAMDVLVDCNGNPAQCSTSGGANNENGINVSVWEQNYNKYIPGPGCCSDLTARVTSVKVRVFRKNADTPTCASYTVTATNQ
jgi:hypothetical protein